MSKSDKLLIFTFVVVLIAALASIEELVELRDRRRPKASDTSIVRVYRPVPGGGVILCSGTVVSATKIVMAAHCLEPTEYDFRPPILEIRTSSDVSLGITAQIASVDSRTDLAILFGDFRTLEQRSPVFGAEELNKAYKNHRVIICGYPMGGRFTCSEVKHCVNALFKFACMGFAYPGMSGGPVIDLDTGKLIGTITAVQDEHVILSPLVEIWKDLHLSEGQ